MNDTMSHAEKKAVNIDALTTIMTDLADLLMEESGLVKELDTKAIEDLQEEKQELINALEKQQQIFTRRNYSDSLTLEQRTELASLYEAFENIALENQRLLGMARQANAHVIEALATSVQEQVGQHGYNPDGSHQHDGNVAFSLNKSI